MPSSIPFVVYESPKRTSVPSPQELPQSKEALVPSLSSTVPSIHVSGTGGEGDSFTLDDLLDNKRPAEMPTKTSSAWDDSVSEQSQSPFCSVHWDASGRPIGEYSELIRSDGYWSYRLKEARRAARRAYEKRARSKRSEPAPRLVLDD